MNKGKLLAAFVGVGALYFVAVGGCAAIAQNPSRWLEVLIAPLTRSTPVDAIIALAALVALSFAALPTDTAFGRETLLRGVAWGAALFAVLCAAALFAFARSGPSETVGALLVIAVCETFVGLTASLLLLTRRESRRRAYAPMVVNTTLTGAAVALFLAPLFR
ncbi:MAG: hypothetical protein KDC38_14930 [Planctomycetes bacterium]|nr:hypothetical protein [Planctomycetota bacterium]